MYGNSIAITHYYHQNYMFSADATKISIYTQIRPPAFIIAPAYQWYPSHQLIIGLSLQFVSLLCQLFRSPKLHWMANSKRVGLNMWRKHRATQWNRYCDWIWPEKISLVTKNLTFYKKRTFSRNFNFIRNTKKLLDWISWLLEGFLALFNVKA